MNNSELYQLAFQCLLYDEVTEFDEAFRNNIIRDEEFILKFIHLSSNHFILPAIFRRIKSKGFSEFLNEDLKEHLNKILQLNIQRNIEIIKQIDEINHYLNNAGIEPVYMKGSAHLLDGLYINPADRMIGDIDFLVQDKDFLPTAEIVLKLGYKTDIEIYDEINTLKDYPRLFRDDVPADIEIHRLPVIPKYSKWFSTELVFNEKKKIQDKLNCYVPSDKHKLIQNFIHSQLSNNGHVFKSVALRDLYDCRLIMNKINIYDVLNEIKERKKAEIYFNIAETLQLGFNTKNTNKKSINYIKIHNWFLNHPRTHYIYIKKIKISELITNRFLKAFVNKTVFSNLMIRLKRREWWKKRLFKGLKDYFS